ncbi:hypothetical protein SERLADRAFT_403272 [Serpula lacrymans var. lacrymans S7.9]|uniref:Uncharacterized protein n=1 Tax=Serpula lacrymans var. lacrymans (strain S7.9) TaxID=578457 RepID=F8PCV5_SERL9|nr:uncharacterized protein SERLADRAFT_403272 [Serpula lacrymans var. lacrymans S7.9]EGO19054.1 hypothetical protein SERLADRAFT_403272 [Serpula lacrymans var. lacrymans S7.9]
MGFGSFKTTHAGWLTLFGSVNNGLGHNSPEEVAVKRLYHKIMVGKQGKSCFGTGAQFLMDEDKKEFAVGRYSATEELNKIEMEANILYWAQSLMSMTYAFIDSTLKSSLSSPSFNIPRVLFVRAGVAIAHTGLHKKGPAHSQTSIRAVYLLEEKINEHQDGEFIKYIHNSDAAPMLEKV